MKKTITKPDGTTIVYEGTAEEIERLERGEAKPIEAVPGIPVPNLSPYTPFIPSFPDRRRWEDVQTPTRPFEIWCLENPNDSKILC